MLELTEGQIVGQITNYQQPQFCFPICTEQKTKHEEKKENTVIMVDKKRKYNIGSLRSESTKFLYQQRLNNKLNRNEFTDTEEMYNYLKNCIH